MSSAVVIPITNSRARHPKRGRMAYLTPGETLVVLKSAREHSIRDWAMILLASATDSGPLKSVGFA